MEFDKVRPYIMPVMKSVPSTGTGGHPARTGQPFVQCVHVEEPGINCDVVWCGCQRLRSNLARSIAFKRELPRSWPQSVAFLPPSAIMTKVWCAHCTDRVELFLSHP